MKLRPIKITREAFNALPMLWTLTEHELQQVRPIGFMCRDGNDTVRELVKGTDMFADQWGAGMSPPARGWRYYAPVFVEFQEDYQI